MLADAEAVINGRGPDLLALSHTVHELGELAFEEHRSAAAVSGMLAAAGFDVRHGVAGMETAFSATYGSGSFAVGICAEYDALPEIGHACGHNIIAASAVGAALGLAEIADRLDLTVVVLGTPAEEHGGGKVLMLEAGLFDDLACAVMVHPGPLDLRPDQAPSQGVARFAVTYAGRAAHAAAAPHLGVNAADAAVLAQVALGLLRQQLPATARVAAFVREGGKVTNIIPEHVVVDVEIREFDVAEHRRLKERVLACFEAGAVASGCSWTADLTEPEYEPLDQDPRLAAAYADAVTGLGREFGTRTLAGGSTDMGNVSQYLPAIHPTVGVIGSEHAPHTHGFAADAASPAGDDAVLDGARALARTIIAVAEDADARAALLAERAARAPYRRPGSEENR
ncbi:amidohydrolase [Nocardioides sp. KR10-350]|uniref:amidohydrolase n=1 Tax=Nocardioides cheoyonin TaxID=3156615 RepID=UPI0032B38F86